MTGVSLKKIIANILKTNFVIEEGSSGDWKWRKWKDGRCEAWWSHYYNQQFSFATRGSSSAFYYTNATWVNAGLGLPTNLFATVECAFFNLPSSGYLTTEVVGMSTTSLTIRAWTPYAASPTLYTASAYVVGTWS